MQMYVAGEWASAADEDQIRSPWSGETVDTVPRATAADVDAALAAAVQGAATMRRLSAYDRAQILERAADLIEDACDELARTISAEEGKPLTEALGEARRGPDLFRLAASEGARLHGETLPLDAAPGGEDKLGFTLRQPCGVVVAITPFNYPLLLVAHKVAPALAAGNAVVLKPASQTPLTALKLTELLLEAGLPPLALQTITGPGGELGDALCADERVRKISFTGSARVGRRIAEVAGRQEALARARRELPGRRAPRRRPRAGRGGDGVGRVRQRGPGVHLGAARARRPRRRTATSSTRSGRRSSRSRSATRSRTAPSSPRSSPNARPSGSRARSGARSRPARRSSPAAAASAESSSRRSSPTSPATASSGARSCSAPPSRCARFPASTRRSRSPTTRSTASAPACSRATSTTRCASRARSTRATSTSTGRRSGAPT